MFAQFGVLIRTLKTVATSVECESLAQARGWGFQSPWSFLSCESDSPNEQARWGRLGCREAYLAMNMIHPTSKLVGVCLRVAKGLLSEKFESRTTDR